MSGLDKMKAQIIAEAQENAKEILAQAHAQADSIIGEAKVRSSHRQKPEQKIL
jgi:V/A-type H+-transporting ATPase subunit E